MPGWRSNGFSPRPSRMAASTAAGWFQHRYRKIAARQMPDAGKWIFVENNHDQEEDQGDQRNHDHPGQEFSITLPFAQGHCRSKGSHQPGPEQQRARLPAPQSRDAQVNRHTVAGYRGDILQLVIAGYQQIDQAEHGERNQRESQQHRSARAFHPIRAILLHTVDSRADPIDRDQERNQQSAITEISNHKLLTNLFGHSFFIFRWAFQEQFRSDEIAIFSHFPRNNRLSFIAQ